MKNKTKPRGRGVTVKLREREFRDAIEGRGKVMDVLIESFGDKTMARICMTYLAASASYQARSHRVIRWFYFAAGVGITLTLAVLIRVFA